MSKLAREIGSTSEIWQIFIQDTTSVTGGGLTGLVFNSSGLTAYYHRDTDTTVTAISLVTMTVGTFTSGGFKEIDSTNMPGWYQFCPTNASLASGASSCGFQLQGATNMAPLPIEVDLNAEVRLSNGVTHGGTTAMLRLGSSTSTPAWYVTNTGGNAVQFETSTASGGVAFYLFGYGKGLDIVSTNTAGARIQGQGGDGLYLTSNAGSGLSVDGSSGEPGIEIYGGTNADAIYLEAAGTGKDINLAGSQSIAGYLTGVASPTFVGPGVLPSSPIKKSTALSNFEFVMYDESDHVTPLIDLTVTATRSIDGGAFAACTNSVSAVSNGVYKITLSTSDLAGDVVTFRFTATGADPTLITIVTQQQ